MTATAPKTHRSTSSSSAPACPASAPPANCSSAAPASAMPSSRARASMGHLGPVPLSGHPLGFRHIPLGYRFRALEGARPSPTALRSLPTSARPPTKRASPAHPLRSQGDPRGLGQRRGLLDGRGRTRRRRQPGAVAGAPALYVCAGYYSSSYAEGHRPAFAGERTSAAAWCIRSSGTRRSTMPASAWW